MKKFIFAVMGVALLAALAACKENISNSQEEPQPQEQIEAAVEEEVEFEGCGFYHIDFDSNLLEFIPEWYRCYDTILGVDLRYSSSSENLSIIHITIDEIVIEKGVRYLFEDYGGFSEELSQKVGDIPLQIGELEILTN